MIGRVEEKKYLQSLLNEEESQFIAVFGRRRIGKTYLVRESFDYKFTFQHTGVSNDDIKAKDRKRVQLDKFSESLEAAGYFAEKKPTSWAEAFNGLKSVIEESKEKKKVIFIDELSWMDTKNSGLVSALESFWNGWVTSRKEKDVILIVCASATYWMMNNIVNSKGGLHNRLTGQIHLKPFNLKECEAYLQERIIIFSRHQILQCYMILGGVPYYWSLLKKGKSLPQNIDSLFFEEGAPLRSEYNNLYRALFNKPEEYIKIIEALSSVNMGISRDDICKETHLPSSGSLTRKLEELENCGFIRKYVPFGYKTKNALYQLIDNYTLFYQRFVKNNVHNEKYWTERANSAEVRAWSGIAFERVCLEHTMQIKSALGIAGVQTEVSTWRCEADSEKGVQGSQIDLVISRKDQVINICEMKYSETDFVPDSAFDKAMRRKIEDFQKVTETKFAIHATLITTYDAVDNPYTGNLQSIVTGEELFA